MGGLVVTTAMVSHLLLVDVPRDNAIISAAHLSEEDAAYHQGAIRRPICSSQSRRAWFPSEVWHPPTAHSSGDTSGSTFAVLGSQVSSSFVETSSCPPSLCSWREAAECAPLIAVSTLSYPSFLESCELDAHTSADSFPTHMLDSWRKTDQCHHVGHGAHDIDRTCIAYTRARRLPERHGERHGGLHGRHALLDTAGKRRVPMMVSALCLWRRQVKKECN